MTKKATTPANKTAQQPAPAAPKPKPVSTPLTEVPRGLPTAVKEALGWDGRVTRYYLSGDPKLKEIMGDPKNFTNQKSDWANFGNVKVREVGAFMTEGPTLRICEVARA